jgi:hypothetical protein
VGIDGFRDGELDQPVPRRDAPTVPGLDRGEVARGRSELAPENAELCKRVDYLEAQLKLRDAQLERKDARFEAWAREIGNRDRMRASREEFQDSRIEDLERKLTERQDAASPGEAERRLENRSATRTESDRQERGRGGPSNEVIAVGVAWTAIALTVISELKGTPAAATVTAYAGEGIAVVAAQLAWYRKRREESRRDRSQG